MRLVLQQYASSSFPNPKYPLANHNWKPLLPEHCTGKTIRVFSHEVKDFVDFPVTIVSDEKHENWISHDLIERLGLKSFEKFDENSSSRSGELDDGMIFSFDGKVSITWSWKEPHPFCGCENFADCLVVPVRTSTIWLKASLFAPPNFNLKGHLPIVSPIPQSVAPGPEGSSGARLERLVSLAGSPVYSAEGSRSDSKEDGEIDEGEMFDDKSNEYAKRLCNAIL
jgi:hypothetical protein